jgi:diketogulonate reductase-like aldo/keto reductase
VALAFLTRLEGTFTIPKAARTAHVRDNAKAGDIDLGAEDVEHISSAFPLPRRDLPLATL